MYNWAQRKELLLSLLVLLLDSFCCLYGRNNLCVSSLFTFSLSTSLPLLFSPRFSASKRIVCYDTHCGVILCLPASNGFLSLYDSGPCVVNPNQILYIGQTNSQLTNTCTHKISSFLSLKPFLSDSQLMNPHTSLIEKIH